MLMTLVCNLQGVIDFLFRKWVRYLLSANLMVVLLYLETYLRSVVNVMQPVLHTFCRLLVQ